MNIVFLFSDEHAASAVGNSGHSVVRTPNLDRLAEKKVVLLTTSTATARYPRLLDDLPEMAQV